MKSLLVKLGVILIGLMILGYAEVCKAEGAWVLWCKITKFTFMAQGQKIESHWDLRKAVPKYEQCIELKIEAHKKEIETWSSYSNIEEVKYKTPEEAIVIVFKHADTDKERVNFMYEFYCLPDTVDPRK